MKTQANTNEATTDKQPPWKMSSNIKKLPLTQGYGQYEKESAETYRKMRTSDNV